MCPMLPLMSEALSYCFIMSSLHLEWLSAQHTAAWRLSPCVIMCHTISWAYCVVFVATVTGECMFGVLFYFRKKIVRHIHLVKHMKSTTDSKVFGCNFEPESLFMWHSVFLGPPHYPQCRYYVFTHGDWCSALCGQREMGCDLKMNKSRQGSIDSLLSA